MKRSRFHPVIIAATVTLAISAIAAVAAIAASTLYRASLDREVGNDLLEVSRQAIAEAELQIDSGVATLLDLALGGKLSCGEANLRRLREAVFTSPVVKSIAIAGLDGAVSCSTAVTEGFIGATSAEYLGRDANVKFAAAELAPGVKALQLRIRIDESAQLLVASIPIAALTSARMNAMQGEEIAWALRLGEGAVLARRELPMQAENRHEVVAQSQRYPLTFEVSIPRAATYKAHAGAERRLLLGVAAATVAVILIGVFAYRRLSERDSAIIRSTLRKGEIVPLFQPIFAIANGKLLGAEVLIRWRLPDGKLVPPGKIIDQIEHTGEIFAVTRSLLTAARDALGDLYAARPSLRMSFNLVPDHFNSSRIARDIKEIFGGSGVAYDQIVLEITERRPLHDFEQARRVVAALHALGCRIALDDVGTGHAGLSYVLKLEADIIKIDKFFVDALELETASAPIIDMLVDLSRRIGMTVVAEGVETMAQLKRLSRLGVDAAQGYLFSKPLTASAYRRLVEAMVEIETAETKHQTAWVDAGLREIDAPTLQPALADKMPDRQRA